MCLGSALAQEPAEDAAPAPAPKPARQEGPKSISLDTSETMFTVLAAINYCGYDAELSVSDPVREQVRTEVFKTAQASAEAAETGRTMCQSYEARKQDDSSRTLAQYVSLALYLNPPPALTPRTAEADMPPDAVAVLGILPPLQKFYTEAGLHQIWQAHAQQYAALLARYHDPLAKMMFDTEIYLKLASAGYLGHGFTILVEPMGAPGQTNARNYGSDYYIVLSPGTDNALKMDLVRHTYLHYLLDPFTLKYPGALKRMGELLTDIKTAPLDESFKDDISLLVTECFVRAIEIRTSKLSDADQEKRVEDSVEQGYILTRYFFEELPAFEKDPAGLRALFGDMLAKIDVGKEHKRASQIHFAQVADPELVRIPKRPSRLLTSAEQKLSAGDKEAAQKLAQQALDEKTEDAGRALFILAEVATMSSDIEGARTYFQKALESTHEPKVLAWSHIYLGRIFDLQENREAAMDQYKAALTAGESLPEAKAAAERGLREAYEPTRRPE